MANPLANSAGTSIPDGPVLTVVPWPGVVEMKSHNSSKTVARSAVTFGTWYRRPAAGKYRPINDPTIYTI